ncbi:MAG: Crp/Fnr family transcriptional regulator [Gammaproteobacteria bacterium]|nr:Crp/Fnr family transcriptional regulator [Gammaproteobacteria bacterium]MCP4981988.1 Crp/Fnr family transcriptional regulator [Gammaproteobacteria bacterium]
MDSKDILEALGTSHLFSELTDEQMDRVRRHSHITDMLEGESLFFQGDNATSFYLVLSGRIKLFRVSPEGKEKVVEIMETGSTFAEALMFMDQSTYPVTATAIAPSRVIGINCNDFKSMLRESIDTCFLLLGKMSFRLRGLIHEIDALSLDTGTVRTVAYLLKQAPSDDDHFELKVAKSVIASRLSVKPETFSRILKNLHEQEIVTIDGRKVTIHDRDAMHTLCSD